MESGEILNSDAARLGRMDVQFLLLYKRHKELVDEMAAGFGVYELRDLASRLPFCKKTAWIVMPKRGLSARPVSRADFDKWLDVILTHLTPQSVTDLAVYCAVASQKASSKVLTEVLRLTEQKAVLVRELQDLLKLAEARSPLLFAAMKDHDGGTETLKETKSGIQD